MNIHEILWGKAKPKETPAPAPAPEPKPITVKAKAPLSDQQREVLRELGRKGGKARAEKRKANPPPGTPAEALKKAAPQ